MVIMASAGWPVAPAFELFHVADEPAEILKIIKTAHAGMSHK